ncbi:Cupin_2 domain-containing protein [Mesorhizobium ventifaucium]|uniref:Cupin_2 domain-containing protein n=2 Tax=Mesorhizobium ventifaucium TaxID=666020 RepID=A0ABN8JW73_9HYPH|nr:Cupin_2 domain-containing protein [Mesorhizobium ventifaucium]
MQGYIMSILQSTKKAVERVTGIARRGRQEATDLVRRRKANEFWFKDDGLVPNHPFWPLVVYRGAVRLPEEFDPAAVLEELFEANGWGASWRNGIYDYVHYHSRIHEVLGVAAGTAKVRFGGKKGRTLSLKAGDVAVLPAGTGHQCLSASDDFLVVGAYPPFGTYDECTTAQEHDRALATIQKVGRPRKDPVYGSKGPLLQNWRKT